MANILNQILNNPIKIRQTYNTSPKSDVKPAPDKGVLLPSKIFGSPIEYAKDLKKDVVAIKNAAIKGKANDHELGRINDVAMKAGALALAAYLCVKNPLKLSKTMEFVGVGTFFGSMALWPKLAIQLPVKLRTGVDIHQKYVDSQGRKKMLFQDPQYDLTDMYSQEDLDRMGKKLNVSENLPDRNTDIKQRAKKIAIQGNTLWMMSAGLATPIMSALACNVLEKPINNVYEKQALHSTKRAMKAVNEHVSPLVKLKQGISDKLFSRFLSKNSDKPLDASMIDSVVQKIVGKRDSKYIMDAVKRDVAGLKSKTTLNFETAKGLLSQVVDPSVWENLSAQQTAAINDALKEGSMEKVASVISSVASTSPRQKLKLTKKFAEILEKSKTVEMQPTIGEVESKLKLLKKGVSDYSHGKKAMDRYISARVGDKSGSFIANQWDRVSTSLVKALNKVEKPADSDSKSKIFSKLASKSKVLKKLSDWTSKIFAKLDLKSTGLRKLSTGTDDEIIRSFEAFAQSDSQSKGFLKDLIARICQYDAQVGDDFINLVQSKANGLAATAADTLGANDLREFASAISTNIPMERSHIQLTDALSRAAKTRASGAQSSFYRLLHTFDVLKQMNDSNAFKTKLRTTIETVNRNRNGEVNNIIPPESINSMVENLFKVCKKVLMCATPIDHMEKLTTSGYKLSNFEYEVVMKTLFDDTISSSLQSQLVGTQGGKVLNGLKSYKASVIDTLLQWRNSLTPELGRAVESGIKSHDSLNATQRSNIVGKPVVDFIRDAAKKTYNSNKWLKIFGGTMIALTAVTISAGLFIGRKGKTEAKVEKETQANG